MQFDSQDVGRQEEGEGKYSDAGVSITVEVPRTLAAHGPATRFRGNFYTTPLQVRSVYFSLFP